MTATTVNGLTVLADEPTRAPFNDGGGGPIHWPQIRTLLLEDGTETFGCVHCDHTAPTAAKVRGHLGKHRPPTPPKTRKARTAEPPTKDMSLTDLLAKVEQIDTVTAERDEWKKRALKAERQLSTLRKALRP